MPTKISGNNGLDVSGLPYMVGQICQFAMLTPPPGFVKCNGQALSRTTYGKLFTAVGTTYGAGNGTTTFNVPEVRGEFIRSLDDGRGIDAGRAIGSAQTDTVQGHFHNTPGANSGGSGIPTTGGSVGTMVLQSGGPVSDGVNGTPRVSAETRSRNIAFPTFIFTGIQP